MTVIADSNGAPVKVIDIDYDSFGSIINDTDPSFEVPFGFARGLHDRDTGLIRFGYRDYDLDVGRWTSKDPILFSGGDTDLYGYVLNDLINWVDPLGLDATLVIDRATGLLSGGDDDGNTLVTRVKENGESITPGDPYGTNGPIPFGPYNINPRPSDLNHPGRPTISSPCQDWNTIVTPQGTVCHGVQIHEEIPGVRSRGCPLTPPGTNIYNELLDLINDEYNDGGVRLYVIDSGFWSQG